MSLTYMSSYAKECLLKNSSPITCQNAPLKQNLLFVYNLTANGLLILTLVNTCPSPLAK